MGTEKLLVSMKDQVGLTLEIAEEMPAVRPCCQCGRQAVVMVNSCSRLLRDGSHVCPAASSAGRPATVLSRVPEHPCAMYRLLLLWSCSS